MPASGVVVVVVVLGVALGVAGIVDWPGVTVVPWFCVVWSAGIAGVVVVVLWA